MSAGGDPVRKAINLDALEPLAGRRAREHRVLRAAAGERPLAGRLRHRARHAVPGAAVRVLRRVRRLRRDPVPEARLAAVRRPADDRQRDRLLVDLRRQPADDAMDRRRRRARPGMVELAVRGQRRVRARPAARRRPPHRAGPPAPVASCATWSAPSWWTRSSRRRSCASRSCARSANASPSWSGGSTGWTSGRRRPAQRARSPDPAQRVDRRRRRLGVRHRLRRPRSRAGQRAQRQRARARHRGLLQHRRADVEGDAARRGREVRRRRQDDAHQGPRAAGDRATPTCTSPGSRWAPTRSRRCARSARPRPTTGRRC